MKRCGICGKEIKRGKNPKYHPICIKRTFGSGYLPEVAVSPEDFSKKKEEVRDKFSIASVQPRLQLVLNRRRKQLEPVGQFGFLQDTGDFILKSAMSSFPHAPEIEKICMTAASLYGIETPHHCLVRLEDYSTAYLVRRYDRRENQTLTQKSIREILGRDNKYMGDLLDAGKVVRRLSEFPGLAVQYFFERLVFSFVVGHDDLHLDSFNMLYDGDGPPRLAPATGIISNKLLLPNSDDFAMSANGKVNGLRGHHFRKMAKPLRIPAKAYSRMVLRFYKQKRVIGRLIKESALTTEQKVKFSEIVNERFKRLLM